jgi:hypothetical protein
MDSRVRNTFVSMRSVTAFVAASVVVPLLKHRRHTSQHGRGKKAKKVIRGKHDRKHTPERPHIVLNEVAGSTCRNKCALLKYQKVPDPAERSACEESSPRMQLPNYVVRPKLRKQPVTILACFRRQMGCISLR